jgi:hypothetical protein
MLPWLLLQGTRSTLSQKMTRFTGWLSVAMLGGAARLTQAGLIKLKLLQLCKLLACIYTIWHLQLPGCVRTTCGMCVPSVSIHCFRYTI